MTNNMSGDGLRDEIAIAVWAVLQREMPSAANTKRADLAADAVLTVVQARIGAARGQVAEQIAQRVRELHQQYRPAWTDEFDVCSHCTRGMDFVIWPCSTARALDGTP